MRKLNKKDAKKGVLALVATGVAVGIGVGVKMTATKIKNKRIKREEMERLKELENEQFED